MEIGVIESHKLPPMKEPRSLLILFLLFIVTKSSSQDFQINLLKVDLDTSKNQLLITYTIDNKAPSDKFHITIEIKRQNGESIEPKTITGDHGDNIKPGNTKIIIWDLGKDTISLDEDISVKIKGEKLTESFSKGSLLLRSIVFPGWGQTKMTGNPWWLAGIAAYGTLAGGFIYYQKSLSTYDLYSDATGQTRHDLQEQYDKEYNISKALFIASASIWVANIIWAAAMPNQKQPLKHANLYIKPVTIPRHQGAMLSLRVDF